MAFLLRRQDDNGHRFTVGSWPDRAGAEQRLAELTRCLHKQYYWIEETGKEAVAEEDPCGGPVIPS